MSQRTRKARTPLTLDSQERLAEHLVRTRIPGARKGLKSEPAFLHSFRVRDLVRADARSGRAARETEIAALLHDIVEDGGVSLGELTQMGFTPRIVRLVDLCSHRTDVPHKTARWTLMMARLAEADDADAWRIKVADLADNLGQAENLDPVSHRFMVETKAPLMARLAHCRTRAFKVLAERAAAQRSLLALRADAAATAEATA